MVHRSSTKIKQQSTASQPSKDVIAWIVPNAKDAKESQFDHCFTSVVYIEIQIPKHIFPK